MKSSSICKPPKTQRIKAGRVLLEPGEEIGEHVTEKREEVIIVIKGIATLIMNGKETEIRQGDACYVGEGKMHNVKNNGKSRLEYVYVVGML